MQLKNYENDETYVSCVPKKNIKYFFFGIACPGLGSSTLRVITTKLYLHKQLGN